MSVGLQSYGPARPFLPLLVTGARWALHWLTRRRDPALPVVRLAGVHRA